MSKQDLETDDSLKDIGYQTPEFQCVNCTSSISWKRPVKLYCSGLCAEESKYVRYHRACIRDGRIGDSYVQTALKIRRAFILAGGYVRLKRNMPNPLRQAVVERDKEKCQVCGKPGNEIDHINGSSNDLENLQLLCKECHFRKTLSGLERIDLDDEVNAPIKLKSIDLDLRTYGDQPLMESDDEVTWQEQKKEMLAERRDTFLCSIGELILRLPTDLTQTEIVEVLNQNAIPTFYGRGKWRRDSVRLAINVRERIAISRMNTRAHD